MIKRLLTPRIWHNLRHDYWTLVRGNHCGRYQAFLNAFAWTMRRVD